MTFRARVFDLLELGGNAGRLGAAIDLFLIGLILANAAAVTLQSVTALQTTFGHWFALFEHVSLAVFSLEYVLRIWAAPERDLKAKPWSVRWRYARTPLAVIDLLAILPTIVFAASDLVVLRVFRLLRLFKLVRYSPALSSLFEVIYAERRAIAAAYLIMLLLMFVAAVALYSLEGGAPGFETIPQSMWWSIVTLTTVGYGDVVPHSDLGRMVAAFLMLLGVGFFALPIGIIASGFTEEIHKQTDVHLKAKVPGLLIIDGIDYRTIKQLVRRSGIRQYDPGEEMIRSDDARQGLFILVSGEALVVGGGKSIPLYPPDFFGSMALYTPRSDEFTIVARRSCMLLWISEEFLQELPQEFPGVLDALQAHAVRSLDRLVEHGTITADEAAENKEILSDFSLP